MVSDGTAAGTLLVKDLVPGCGGRMPRISANTSELVAKRLRRPDDDLLRLRAAFRGRRLNPMATNDVPMREKGLPLFMVLLR
jgi:hypothetical protein